MNNAITQLGSLGVTFSTANLYGDFAAGDPDHILSEYMAAWNAQTEEDGDGVVMNLGWIKTKAGW
jgi:hypothetical protein